MGEIKEKKVLKNFRLSWAMVKKLDRIASETGFDRTELVEQALDLYLEETAKQRLERRIGQDSKALSKLHDDGNTGHRVQNQGSEAHSQRVRSKVNSSPAVRAAAASTSAAVAAARRLLESEQKHKAAETTSNKLSLKPGADKVS